MKKILLFLAVLASCTVAFSQAPLAFNYQAIVRNSSGEIVPNKAVSFRISILSGSENGSPVYSEIHSVSTNNFGLANLKIGMGSNKSGSLSPDEWGNNELFLKIELDINGGATFSHMGTSQLLSVPYALHAKTVAEDNVDDNDADPENEIQELLLSGTVLSLSKSDVSVTLPSSGSGDNWGTDVVVSDTTLDGQGTSANPLKIGQQGASEGQVLKWDGTMWIPADEDNPDNDPVNEIQELSLAGAQLSLNKDGGSVDLSSIGGDGLTLPYNGNVGYTNYAFELNNSEGGGLRAYASGTTEPRNAISGQTASPGGMGVKGGSLATTGSGVGVYGRVASADGFSGFFEGGKFYVSSNVGFGTENPTAQVEVAGQVKITGGAPGAGKVLTSDAGGLATWETPSGGGGLTLPYNGNVGYTNYAFELNNSEGGGLRAYASGTTEPRNAISGQTASPGGMGVKGGSLATTGSGVGVYGRVASADGFSGFFEGGKFYVSSNVGFGTENPTAQLEVAGQVKITGGAPGAGKVLTSDAGGLASWETPSGGGGLTLPYNGNVGYTNYAFELNNSEGGGLRAYASGTTEPRNAISGQTASPGGMGVKGGSLATTGSGVGVYGRVASADGFSGFFEGGKFYVNSKVGFGTENPTAQLEVAGQVKITGGTPGAGKVLTSDAGGLATWETPSGGSGLTLPYTENVSSNDNLFKLTNEGEGHAIHGIASSGGAIGVFGESNAVSGTGISGLNIQSTGVTFGVRGEVISASGYSGHFTGGKFHVNGNVGFGTENPTAQLEVAGQVKITGGGPGAGKVLTSDAGGLATWETPSGGGISLPYSGTGSSSDNLFEVTNTGNGSAISGSTGTASQWVYGVKGQTSATSGTGVQGFASSTSGNPSGVLGQTNAANGAAILGLALSTSGTNYGVWGLTSSNSGYSGYFEGGRFYIMGNTGIGTTNPSAKLEVSGQVKITGGSPGAGKVLTSDSGGLGSWQTPSGGSSLWTQSASNIFFNTGNVGIGTSSPADKLEVNGNITLSAGADRYIALPDGSMSLFLGGKKNVTAAYAVHIVTNGGSGGQARVTVVSDKVGIGTTSPSQNLDVNGNARFRSIGSGAYAGVVNRTSDGTLTTSTSDIRLKENIKPLEGSLDKIMKLRGVNFTWKNNPEYGQRIGFIAQEFEKVVPELVFTNPTDGYKGINYAEVSAILVEAVKELKTENELLKSQNQQILDRLEQLERSVIAVNKTSQQQ